MDDSRCISELILVQNQMREELERQDSLIVDLTDRHLDHSSYTMGEISDLRLKLNIDYKTKTDELFRQVSMIRTQIMEMEWSLRSAEEELNRYKNL